MLPENWFWKEVGCRRNSSTLVGQVKVKAKPDTRRKAQTSNRLCHCADWYEVRWERAENENLRKGGRAKRYRHALSQ